MSKDREALEPCPFCGGNAVYVMYPLERWSVQCDEGTCDVNPETANTTKAEAAEQWNRRALTQQESVPVAFASAEDHEDIVSAGELVRLRAAYPNEFKRYSVPLYAAPPSAPTHQGPSDAVQREGWKPMLTAPLDGTEIELMVRHQMYWTALKVSKEAADREWQGVVRAKWIDHNGGGWTWNGHAGGPVAWRSLAAAPSPEPSGSGR